MSAAKESYPSQSISKISPTDPAQYIPYVTSLLDRITAEAAKLPAKADLSFHRSLDRKFAQDTDKASDLVLKITESCLKGLDEGVSQAGSRKGKRRALEDEEDVGHGYRRNIVPTVNGLLEDADTCLDAFSGQAKKSDIVIPPKVAAAARQKLPGPLAPETQRFTAKTGNVKSSPGAVSVLSITSLNRPKPQLLFQDTVDNSLNRPPWQPTLAEKAHAMVPMGHPVQVEYQLSPAEEADPGLAKRRVEKEVRKTQHPYVYETRHLSYPTTFFSIAPPVPPQSFEETIFEYVDTPESLGSMIEDLKKASEIAVDLEHYDHRSFYGFTCLMQISVRGKDWVVDVLKLRQELKDGKLGGVMVDPTIIKVMHGAASDIVWLQKDFDIYIVNLFDTYDATNELEYEAHSLKYLLQRFCDFPAQKQYQLADWRIRPLTEEMLHYARADTHFLLYIYDNLRNALLEKSSRPPSPTRADVTEGLSAGLQAAEDIRPNPQRAMRRVLRASAETALQLYQREGFDHFTGRGTGGWSSMRRLLGVMADQQAGVIFKRLCLWRDKVARELDESHFYIASQEDLRRLSATPPLRIWDVPGIIKSPVILARSSEMWKVIKNAKDEWDAKVLSNEEAESNAPQISSPGNLAPSQSEPEVWEGLTNPRPPSIGSALFGVPHPQSRRETFGNGTHRQPVSSLFGSKLSKTFLSPSTSRSHERASSPKFDLLKLSIHTDISAARVRVAEYHDVDPSTPPLAASLPSSREETQEGLSARLLGERETVPFVPRAIRTTSSVPSTAVSQPAKSAPPEDGIVQVKKSQKAVKRALEASGRATGSSSELPTEVGLKKKKKSKTARSDDIAQGRPTTPIGETSLSGSTSTNGRATVPGDPAKITTKAKAKKKKIQPEDIPSFDYANEPNLLVNPESAKRPKGSKKDRKKGQPSNRITDTKFGKVPKAKAEMKEGNRSGTFT